MVELRGATSAFPPSQVSLKIGIVGAGIAGLAAAVTLRGSGHDIELFEKSRFASEIGAGLHMTPNSSKVLQHYGFDFAAANGSEATEVAFINPADGTVLHSTTYPDVQEKYGAPWLLFHRNDLHRQLKKHATDVGMSQGQPARLLLQTLVEDVDTDGTIYFADGSNVKKDLIIIANGIHTDLIEKIIGTPIKNEAVGKALVRFLIPMEEVAKDPRCRLIHEAGLGRFLYCIRDDRNFISYPCRSNTMANGGIFYNDDIDWQGAWSLPATKQELMQACEGYPDMFVALCDKANDLSKWRLAVRSEPLQKLVNDRVVLVGDAAHPMLPFLGQGAAMAIEDAGALAVFMNSITSVDDVPQRLKLFQSQRKDRVCAVQILSNWWIHGYTKVVEQSKPFFSSSSSSQPHDKDTINEWCFNRDEISLAEQALREHLSKAS